MALSEELRRRLQYAMGDIQSGNSIADSIDSGGNPVAANVAAIPSSSDLSLSSPVASSLNSVFDNSEVESALDSKADQSAVSSLMSDAESRLDALEAKQNAVIAALKAAGLMSNS